SVKSGAASPGASRVTRPTLPIRQPTLPGTRLARARGRRSERSVAVAGERSADEIQHDIEQSRTALAQAVDELAYRTNPKRVVENTKASLKARARTPEGKAVI